MRSHSRTRPWPFGDFTNHEPILPDIKSYASPSKAPKNLRFDLRYVTPRSHLQEEFGRYPMPTNRYGSEFLSHVSDAVARGSPWIWNAKTDVSPIENAMNANGAFSGRWFSSGSRYLAIPKEEFYYKPGTVGIATSPGYAGRLIDPMVKATFNSDIKNYGYVPLASNNEASKKPVLGLMISKPNDQISVFSRSSSAVGEPILVGNGHHSIIKRNLYKNIDGGVGLASLPKQSLRPNHLVTATGVLNRDPLITREASDQYNNLYLAGMIKRVWRNP